VIRAGDNHHHIVCRQCGRTEDVDCVVGERPCLEPADEHGFAIDAAEVVFRGLCPACAAAKPGQQARVIKIVRGRTAACDRDSKFTKARGST
jgi:Fur family transcriptional regulator, stress-responsive regulator